MVLVTLLGFEGRMPSCVQTGTFRFDSLCVMATVSYILSQCCFHCQIVEDAKEKQISSNGVQNGVSWELVIDLSKSLHFSTEIFFAFGWSPFLNIPTIHKKGVTSRRNDSFVEKCGKRSIIFVTNHTPTSLCAWAHRGMSG